MRILHVLPSQAVGEPEIATRRLAEAVRPLGVESSVMLLRPTQELADYYAAAGVRSLCEAQAPEPSLIREAPRFLRQSRAVARSFRQFDVIHCADTPAAAAVALAGRLARRPVICHVRTHARRIPARAQVLLKAADHFVFASHETRDAFPVHPPSPRASVIYDGVAIPPLRA